MTVNILKLAFIFILISVTANAQTLKLDVAERIFLQTPSQFVDSLKKERFRNLTLKDLEEEDFLNSTSEDRPITKDKLFTKTGIRKSYELRKEHYGGLAKLTIAMKEPTCKKVEKVYWNANLRFDVRYYVNKFEALGYEKLVENNVEKYINKAKGLVITVKIIQRSNEILFMMSRVG